MNKHNIDKNTNNYCHCNFLDTLTEFNDLIDSSNHSDNDISKIALNAHAL